jgi:hypothetical protein
MRNVVFISRNRHLVALRSVSVAADALINVRGHVHHVACAGHQGQQAIGRSFSLVRLIGFPSGEYKDGGRPGGWGCGAITFSVSATISAVRS